MISSSELWLLALRLILLVFLAGDVMGLLLPLLGVSGAFPLGVLAPSGASGVGGNKIDLMREMSEVASIASREKASEPSVARTGSPAGVKQSP